MSESQNNNMQQKQPDKKEYIFYKFISLTISNMKTHL